MAKFTEETIKKLPVKDKRYSVSDHGLAVEVLPSGKKTFCCWQGGRKFTFGRWPEMSLREGREAFVKLKNELVTDGALKPKITFRSFLEGAYNDKHLALRKQGDASLKRMKHIYLTRFPLIADMALRAITTEHVDTLKVSLIKQYAPSTAKRELGDLKACLNKAVEWGYLRHSPAAGVKDPKVDRYGSKLHLSSSEVDRLSEALEEWKRLGDQHDSPFREKRRVNEGFYGNAHPRWFFVLVKVLMNTGMRKGEVLALKWGDIDFELRQIIVRGETSKGGQTRRIPISKKLLVDLLEWHWIAHEEEVPDEVIDPDAWGDFIPPEPDENVWPVKSIPKPWERLRKLAKLDKTFTPHLLRHHFASSLVNLGRPLTQVQALLGHKDIATTQIYLSVRQEDLAEAVDLL